MTLSLTHPLNRDILENFQFSGFLLMTKNTCINHVYPLLSQTTSIKPFNQGFNVSIPKKLI